MSWQQAGGLLPFNDLTGAMETSNTELADVRAQLDRAIAAAQEGRWRRGAVSADAPRLTLCGGWSEDARRLIRFNWSNTNNTHKW